MIPFVTYEQFGAKADGVTDDMAAIVAAHDYANAHGMPVRVPADAKYYIGSADLTATIQTDTDWGNACFTVDDRVLENVRAPIFRVISKLSPLDLTIPSLMKGQKNAGVAPGVDCYVVIVDSTQRRYIRRGANQNNGSPQTDNFELKADGTICHELLWDFPQIDRIEAYPIEEETLEIRGGYFTTIANQAPSTYNYHHRGIVISRSNTLVNAIHHYVTGEGETGAPYTGFINVSRCSRVTVQNCHLSAHKIYTTIGNAGIPVSMGTYDIAIGSATDVLFKDCIQMGDILDRTRWGLTGSNFCKNITLDGCVFSRMDAHQGVHTYTIKNTTLGHMGLNAIGAGKLTVENCVLYGGSLINFRSDYGSVWDGDVEIKNVIWHPASGRSVIPDVFGAYNDGQHDYGYPCTMPHTITMENVFIDDTAAPADYDAYYLWSNYNKELNTLTTDTFEEKHHYRTTDKITLKNVTTARGKPWKLCRNALLKPAAEVVEE